VVRLVLGHAMFLSAVGVTIGLGAAAAVTGLLQGLLYDVRPLDPVSFAGGAIVLVAVALVASLIPARRAASLNAIETLRAE